MSDNLKERLAVQETITQELQRSTIELEKTTSGIHETQREISKSIAVLTTNQELMADIKNDQKEIKEAVFKKLEKQQTQIHELDKKVSENTIKLTAIVSIAALIVSLAVKFVPTDLISSGTDKTQGQIVPSQRIEQQQFQPLGLSQRRGNDS